MERLEGEIHKRHSSAILSMCKGAQLLFGVREDQTKTTLRYQIPQTKNTNIKCSGSGVKPLEPLYTAGSNYCFSHVGKRFDIIN